MRSLGYEFFRHIVLNMPLHKLGQIFILMERKITGGINNFQVAADGQGACPERPLNLFIGIHYGFHGFSPDIHLKLCSGRNGIYGLSALRYHKMYADSILISKGFSQKINTLNEKTHCVQRINPAFGIRAGMGGFSVKNSSLLNKTIQPRTDFRMIFRHVKSHSMAGQHQIDRVKNSGSNHFLLAGRVTKLSFRNE